MAGATASLLDTANMEKNRTANREVRKMTADAFTQPASRRAVGRQLHLRRHQARLARVSGGCRQQGVAVGRAFPPLLNWARISIGTRREMEKALPVFMKVLAPPPAQTARYEHLDGLPSELT